VRMLLDTHAFLWWIIGSSRMPAEVRRAIGERSNRKLISAASAWEITTKYRLGKLPGAAVLANDIAGAIAGEGFEELPVTVEDSARAGLFPGPHREPFDRMLIAQALSRDPVLVSVESLFDGHGVRRLW